MAQPWSAVGSNPQYQALTPDKQKAAKQQYFDTVVAPKVPKESLPAAQSQFFESNDNASPAETMAKNQSDKGPSLAAWEGATFGFGDEIDAAIAGGVTGAKNLATRALGGKPAYSAGEAFNAVENQERVNAAAYETNHPMANFASELFGGLLTGGGPAKGFIEGGGSVASRMGRSALTGAGYGALAGAGSGQGEDFVSGSYNRLKGALEASPLGAAIGLVPGAAAELTGPAKRAMGYAGRAFRSVFQSIAGKTPEDAIKTMKPEELKKVQEQALNYVKQVIDQSGGKVENLTKDTAHLQGKPVTSAEAIGRVGQNQLASIARRSGETPDLTESQLRQRGQEAPERIRDDLAKASGVAPESVQGSFDKGSTALRTKAAPLYEKAYAEPAPKDNKVLNELMTRPSMKKAIIHAAQIAKEEGRNPADELKNPTIQTLDYVKRGLQDVLDKYKTISGHLDLNNEGRAIQKTLREFREEMFKISPAYKEAVAAGGEPLQLEEAYKAAPKLMSLSTSEDAFNKTIHKMTPAQREATKGGWVNNVYEGLRSGKMKPKDTQTENFQHKARVLLGVDKADEFISHIQQELRLKANADRMMPGRQSITGELKEASAETDQKTDEFIHGITDNLIRRGIHVTVARAANDALFSVFRAARTPEQEALRNEVGKLLLLKPEQLRARLEAKTNAPTPKAKEIGKMLLHLSAGPTAAAITEENRQ